MSPIITLTLAEIIEIAQFAGLHVVDDTYNDDDLSEEYTIAHRPTEGVANVGEPDDPDSVSYYARIVFTTDSPEEGCVGLGPELSAPPASAVVLQFQRKYREAL